MQKEKLLFFFFQISSTEWVGARKCQGTFLINLSNIALCLLLQILVAYIIIVFKFNK